jgi:hypothetical protein
MSDTMELVRPVVRYSPRHAKESRSDVDSRPPCARTHVREAALDYLTEWYPSSHWRMRPLLSSFAYDDRVSPDLYDELANELLDCPPDHARARDLVVLARLIVEYFGIHP